MPPERYRALFDLWRSGDLTMRMRLFVSAVDAGQEYQQLSDWLRHVQVRFGDDLLRLNGSASRALRLPRLRGSRILI